MRLRMMVVAVMLVGTMQAQTASPVVGTQTTPARAADGLLRMFEGECMGVAKAMPADKYDFSPASLGIAGAKFEGVRTFADQVKHLTQANYFFASTVSGVKPDVDLKTLGALKGKDEIVAALAKSFAFLHQANATLTTQNAFEVVDFEGAKSTRSGVASFAVAHGFDHYGQMVEYLRMNGMAPPASTP